MGEQPFGQVAPFNSTSFDAVATVVLAAPALADLERLIVTRSLPATAPQRSSPPSFVASPHWMSFVAGGAVSP
jgi:hypothetical protein